MFQLLHYLIEGIQPALVPLCFFLAWTFLVLLGWSLLSAIWDTTVRAKQMHEIPCTHCRFFTNDHRLKCTIQPFIANTEEAIDCSDYCPQNNIFSH